MDMQSKGSLSNLAGYFDDRVEEGVCRVDRSIFTDPEIFERELELIWEGNWIYLAHESQIPNPNDYMTLMMGRQPVILARDDKGRINAFINACTHRGATLLRECKGNRADYACPFHGWTFNSAGELIYVHMPEGYDPSFDQQAHNLVAVPKVENLHGFIFGSLNADVPTLREHLGGAAKFVEIFANQGEQGLEVLKGASTYTFDGNWKMQAENGVDGYHLFATHGNYVMTTEHRRKLRGEQDAVKAVQVGNMLGKKGQKLQSGFFDFGNGSVLLWGDMPNPEDRPLWPKFEQMKEKFGESYARFMVSRLGNLLLYPNVFLMNQMSTQIRVFRPLAVDKTEVTIYAIAPKGEDPVMRERRIRQWEDFFNASGMATPDDIMEFSQSQLGFNGRLARWNEVNRGIETLVPKGQNHPEAAAVGAETLTAGTRLEDEGIMAAQHRYWLKAMSGQK